MFVYESILFIILSSGHPEAIAP